MSMNRRSFLKAVGLTSAAVAVAPLAVVERMAPPVIPAVATVIAPAAVALAAPVMLTTTIYVTDEALADAAGMAEYVNRALAREMARSGRAPA